jgi:hypothetical protein
MTRPLLSSSLLKKFLFVFLTLLAAHSYAREIYTVTVDVDNQDNSVTALKQRVYQLERAVRQLQETVFALQLRAPEERELREAWVCKISAMGESFSASAASRAVAEDRVLEKCKKSPSSQNGFFCKNVSCAD